MIDLHSHVLAGIDDGPDRIEDSLALARASAAAGIKTLIATPHVSWHYPNDADTIAGLTADLAPRLRAQGMTIEIRPGAEIAATKMPEIAVDELARLTLGGGEWLLVEFPFTPVATGLDGVVAEAQARGHRVLIAHPERCPAFHRNPGLLRSLVHDGALTSITAGALVGRFGDSTRRFAIDLLAEELVHNVASDLHNLDRRPPGIAAELQAAGLGELREWLTVEVPSAILDGGPIPARPPVTIAPRSGAGGAWWRRLRRAWWPR